VDFLVAKAYRDYDWGHILPNFRCQVHDTNCRVGVWQIVWGRSGEALKDAERAVTAGAQEICFFQYDSFQPGGHPPAQNDPDNRPLLKQVCHFVHG